MRWIHDYKLFLFDFDGLLVNTEEMHFLAYKQMCLKYGFDLDWTFERYCQTAHYSADILKNELFEKFPKLQEMEPSWDLLYGQKKENILKLLDEGQTKLMPGVEALLTELQKANIKRVVVTHSPIELIRAVCQNNPILRTIPSWITRHDYTHPKPDSECYLKAISMYATDDDAVIGFEDTPRGMQALLGTRAVPVLVCKANYPEIPSFIDRGVKHFKSFEDITDSSTLNRK